MKSINLFFLSMILPLSIYAKESPEWFKRASEFCTSYGLSNSKMKCQKKVSAAEFISPEALGLCKDLSMSDLKTRCLDTIINKTYRDEEIAACKLNSLSSEKIKCLADIGKPFEKKKRKRKHDPKCEELSKEHRERLEDILGMLEDGRYKRAQKNLKKLLEN